MISATARALPVPGLLGTAPEVTAVTIQASYTRMRRMMMKKSFKGSLKNMRLCFTELNSSDR
jgi:hypothetical protein